MSLNWKAPKCLQHQPIPAGCKQSPSSRQLSPILSCLGTHPVLTDVWFKLNAVKTQGLGKSKRWMFPLVGIWPQAGSAVGQRPHGYIWLFPMAALSPALPPEPALCGDRQPRGGQRDRPPALPGVPGAGRALRWERTPQKPGVPGVPRPAGDGRRPPPGALCRAAAGASGAPGTGTDGQGNDAVRPLSLSHPQPPQPSSPFPASRSRGTPRETLDGMETLRKGLGEEGNGGPLGRNPLQNGSEQDAGAEGRGQRVSDGTRAGPGVPAPRQSLTTGTCWEWDGAVAPLLAGLPAVRRFSLPSSSSSSVFFLFSYFSLFPPLALRGGAKRDGRAGRLTLALPLCPPPPAAPAGRELLSAGRGRGRGGLRVTPHTFPWGPSPWGAADGTLTHQQTGGPPQHAAGSSAAQARRPLWDVLALPHSC